uniref:Peptidase S1 domain-containing protein n=1 Tax=Timema cristinae TaxID=61476 RepID=A0A7R9DPJ0_TIMCR|nr:unnamed protein product [Timema cristinae]CAD7418705.1 unnamed protein product [Timema cristinae]
MSTITWDCTGSLISDLYVMTAAHCVRTRTGKKLVRVRLGSIDLNSRSDDSEEFQVEDSFVVHPGYSTIRSYNDIALIRLPRKVKLNERLFPACLYTREDLPRGPFTIAGWGATDKDGLMMSTELRKAMIHTLVPGLLQPDLSNRPQTPDGT